MCAYDACYVMMYDDQERVVHNVYTLNSFVCAYDFHLITVRKLVSSTGVCTGDIWFDLVFWSYCKYYLRCYVTVIITFSFNNFKQNEFFEVEK